MSFDIQWDALVRFYEYMISNAEAYPTDNEEMVKNKALERDGWQKLIDLVGQLRRLPSFQDIRPGRYMPLMVLRPDGSDKCVYLNKGNRPGYFVISQGVLDNDTWQDIPDSEQWIPDDEIVSRLEKLMDELRP